MGAERDSPQDHTEKLLDPLRLAALRNSELMDSPADAAFDRFTRLAARWLAAPVALVSLVDGQRQFFKSQIGVPEPWATQRETPLSYSFCQYGVSTAEPLIVRDARQHPWLKHNLGLTELGAIAYAGVPLFTTDSQVLGMLCVVDSQPRAWSDDDVAVLEELAALVCTEIALRERVRALEVAERAREVDRNLLRSVLDCMADSVLVSDVSGQVLLNNRAAEVSGFDALLLNAERGAAARVFLADGQTPITAAASPLARVFRGESVQEAEFLLRREGLADQWHSVNSAPIRDSSGTLRAVVSVGRNVTHSKSARDALARSEALFRTVVQSLPNGAVLLFDLELRYLMAEGEHLLTLMGFNTRDLLGKTPYDVVPAERAEAVASRYRTTLSGTVQEFEIVRGERTYATTVVPVRHEHGVIIAGMALVYDVTAHKRVQAALRRQTLVFQSTLEHMREGVVMVTPDGEFGVFNRAAKAFFGGQPEKAAIAKLLEQLRITDVDGLSPISGRAGPLGRALRGEVGLPRVVVVRDGDDAAAIHLHVTVDPILGDEDELLGTVAVLHDVTAQRAAERLAIEESKRNELLQAIAAASNSALSIEDAFAACLDRVCRFMNWPLGHVYIVDNDILISSGLWQDEQPDRFLGFRQRSAQLEFARGVGLMGQVLETGKATWLSDLGDQLTYVRSDVAKAAGLASGFAFPVLSEAEVVAVLEFYSERKEEADPRLLSLMANVGTQLGRVVERERARKAAAKRADALRDQSLRDELTGLYNRRGFLELAREQLRLAEREGRQALLFFVDLNGMKQINDELGHDEGDLALIDTAEVLREVFRSTDVVARLGGDEFVALMLDAGESLSEAFGLRIKQCIATRNARGTRRFWLSASVGASQYDRAKTPDIEALLARADALMYEQKRARRAGRLLSMGPTPFASKA